MCDKELLLGYLYAELSAPDREAFDRHLVSCAECREEVDGLRATRTHLAAWAPPEPDLGFQVVRGPQAVAARPARGWHVSPAWGLAAAALLVLAVAGAIANVEVRVGSDGILVRTGWNRGPAVEAELQTPAPVSAEDLQRVDERVKELESQLAARQNTVSPAPASADAGRMSDAEMQRYVRRLVAESEERQQGVLARQILQVNRDNETARRMDIDRLGRGMIQIQRTAAEASQRQRVFEDLVRVGLQR